MRKKILLMLSVFCFMGATVFAQTNQIEGGAGVIHVDGNPNLNADLVDVSVNEGHVAYDRDNQMAYFFDPAGTAYDILTPLVPGTQWIAVDVSSIVDPITSIVVTAGDTELTASAVVAGVVTLSFESDATITWNAADNDLTFTDLDGDDTTVNLDDLETDVSAGDGISVTGDAVNGWVVSLASYGASGEVPVSNGGTGTLTWTTVVQEIGINADGGSIDITTTDGNTASLDLANIPTVANMADIATERAELATGEEGIVRAAVNNTFGLTATADVGVLFFINSSN